MPDIRKPWVNVIAGMVGGFALAYGLGTLYFGFSVTGTFWAVAGFLVLGWAIFDSRKFRPGTPESETDGGRTIE